MKLMLKKLKYKDIVWLDLESPTEEELEQLGTELDLHPLVVNELKSPSLRTKVDLYSDYIYLILHFPVIRAQGAGPLGGRGEQQEVDFIIGKNFILTAHYESVNSLHDFAKIFETDFGWKKNGDKLHAGFIFFYILRELYATLENGLGYNNDRLKAVEREIFSGREREVVETLAEINRELIDYRWTLKSHKEVLQSLEIAGVEIFGAKFQYYLSAASGAREKLWHLLESLGETFTDLSETNNSLLAIKTNNIMRALTVAAFVFLPLSIVPQVFGMNTRLLPFADSPFDFYLVLALMALSSTLLYLVARYKRWF